MSWPVGAAGRAREGSQAFFLGLLADLSRCGWVGGVQSKRVAGDLVDFLQRATIPVSEFSARLDEMDRMQTFRQFQAGKTKVQHHHHHHPPNALT